MQNALGDSDIDSPFTGCFVGGLTKEFEDDLVPASRTDTWGSDEVRQIDVRIIRAIRPLHQHRMIDRQEERKVVQAIANADRLDLFGWILSMTLSSIAAEQDFCGSSFVVIAS